MTLVRAKLGVQVKGISSVSSQSEKVRACREQTSRLCLELNSARCGQVETKRFNELYSQRNEEVPEGDFLAVVAKQAHRIYHRAFHELTRQVGVSGLRMATSYTVT